jgi:hypothetical protein
MESCAIGPVEFPRRRCAARLSPRSAAFLNIAVALHDFSSPMLAVLRGWSVTSRLMVLLGSERTLVGWVKSRCRPRKSSRRRTWPSRALPPLRVLPTGTPRCQTVGERLVSRRGTKP